MFKNHNSLLHNLGVIALCYFIILVFCPEHNTKTIRGIDMKLHWYIDPDEGRIIVQELYFSFA